VHLPVVDPVLSRRMFANVTALSIGAIFAVSAASKWLRPSAGSTAIAGYGVVPQAFLPVAAIALLRIETALAGVLLLAPVAPVGLTRIGLLAAMALFALFALVIARGIFREQEIPCGCLGEVVELRLGRASVALNVGAVVCAATAAAALSADALVTKTWVVAYECAALVSVVYWLTTYAASVRGLVGQDLSRRAIS
jgi:hypothetical protein